MKKTWQYLLIGLVLANVLALIMLYQRFQTMQATEHIEVNVPDETIILEEPVETINESDQEMSKQYAEGKPIRADQLIGNHVLVTNGDYEMDFWHAVSRYYHQIWIPEDERYDGYEDEVRTDSYNEEVAEITRIVQQEQQANPTLPGNSSKKIFYSYDVNFDRPIIWKSNAETYYYLNTIIVKGRGKHIITGEWYESEDQSLDIVEFKLENGEWLANSIDRGMIDPDLLQNFGNRMHTR